MMPFRCTKKRLTRVATNTSSRTIYSQSVKNHMVQPPTERMKKTNLGRKFLNIIDSCFPKGQPLHKIFNKHTLKLSYSSMPNMKRLSIISSHNKARLSDYPWSQTQTNGKKKEKLQEKRSMPNVHFVTQII